MFNKQQTAERQNQQFNARQHGCGSFGRKFTGMFGDAIEGKAKWRNAFNERFSNPNAANIEETDTTFIISLYAAGLQKNDFTISVAEDILTISYTAPTNNPNHYAHLEYQPGSFERSFHLNGKVITNSISATYIDGVLKVSLPKNPETNKPVQQVKVD